MRNKNEQEDRREEVQDGDKCNISDFWHTMRREARTEAVSETGLATVAEGNWVLGEGKRESAATAALSVASWPTSAMTGSSGSSAAWRTGKNYININAHVQITKRGWWVQT